jgi:polyphosphate kinase
MSGPAPLELKWDVPTPQRLRELLAAPLPFHLRAGPPRQGFHRDIYYDTLDAALDRRGIRCRVRIGADDRRTLRLTLPPAPASDEKSQRFEVDFDDLDPMTALTGASEPARRLSGLVNPAALQVLVELETERFVREAERGWIWGGRFLLRYDLVVVRRGTLVRGFQEIKLRRLRRGAPGLDQLSATLAREHGLRPILETKVARAQRLIAALEREAVVRSLGSGRVVTLIAVDQGRIALRWDQQVLRLPRSEGQGEAACRHLLQETFGSTVADLAQIGTAPGQGAFRLQEVWLARRIRREGSAAGMNELVWLPPTEVMALAGSPGLSDPETLGALAVGLRSELMRDRGATPTEERPHPTAALPEAANPALFLDADISLLEFNLRVLSLAEDPATPLLERLAFLAIVSSNLDEFFMVNVGSLKGDPESQPQEWAGRLEAIALRLAPLRIRQQRCLEHCLAELSSQGVRLRRWADLDSAERKRLQDQFRREIFPLLAPRAITLSPGFPVPVMPQLTLCLAVVLQDSETGPVHFAYLRIPERLRRFIPVTGPNDLVLNEEVIRANLQSIYPDREVEGAFLFRITRAGDLELQEDETGDLLQTVEEAVGRRRFNPIVRVEVESTMPAFVRERLLWELRFEREAAGASLGELDVYEVEGMLDLRSLPQLAEAPAAHGRFPPFEGRDPLAPERPLWSILQDQDVLLHHPYDGFSPSVVRFFSDAAEDPEVAAIRVTLYRVGTGSPIVDALLHAAATGKEVSAFVELKARFDEARNIDWVRRLEEAGVQVVYGVEGLKNHAKVGLVVRREGEGLRRYVHLGTGNYNASTARFYTDLGLLSADPELGADVNDLFNELTGSSQPPAGAYRRLIVAPKGLLPWLLDQIAQETTLAKAGQPARIRAKLNGLADGEVIQALYRASQAGVEIDLVIRGLCTLRPGVSGLSERIRVVSILGRFLEHARVYHFGAGGADRYYIGSADWRPRNLRRRVEVVTPISDPGSRQRVAGLLDLELADPRAWALQPDGSYLRRAPTEENLPRGSQERLIAETLGSFRAGPEASSEVTSN